MYEEKERIGGIQGTQVMTESKEKLLIDIRELSALTGTLSAVCITGRARAGYLAFV
jgi:hypothetical protein